MLCLLQRTRLGKIRGNTTSIIRLITGRITVHGCFSFKKSQNRAECSLLSRNLIAFSLIRGEPWTTWRLLSVSEQLSLQQGEPAELWWGQMTLWRQGCLVPFSASDTPTKRGEKETRKRKTQRTSARNRRINAQSGDIPLCHWSNFHPLHRCQILLMEQPLHH